MRLIDADTLRGEVLNDNTYDNDTVNYYLGLIDAAPTIDSVKRGEWHETDASPHWLCCSLCFKKYVPDKGWIDKYDMPRNFCPNCGADMRPIK